MHIPQELDVLSIVFIYETGQKKIYFYFIEKKEREIIFYCKKKICAPKEQIIQTTHKTTIKQTQAIHIIYTVNNTTLYTLQQQGQRKPQIQLQNNSILHLLYNNNNDKTSSSCAFTNLNNILEI